MRLAAAYLLARSRARLAGVTERPYVLVAVAVLAVALAAPGGDYLHLYPPHYWRAGG